MSLLKGECDMSIKLMRGNNCVGDTESAKPASEMDYKNLTDEQFTHLIKVKIIEYICQTNMPANFIEIIDAVNKIPDCLFILDNEEQKRLLTKYCDVCVTSLITDINIDYEAVKSDIYDIIKSTVSKRNS